jgi:hypothetical protein
MVTSPTERKGNGSSNQNKWQSYRSRKLLLATQRFFNHDWSPSKTRNRSAIYETHIRLPWIIKKSNALESQSYL